MAARDVLAGTRLVRRRPAMPVVADPARPAIEHEHVIVRRGERSHLYMLAAVHSTALGPAVGGCRMWHYPNVEAGLRDVLLLSSAMTLKAAAAGLELGGGKGVICRSADEPRSQRTRRAALTDFAELVEGLGGSYVTAEDVGTRQPTCP